MIGMFLKFIDFNSPLGEDSIFIKSNSFTEAQDKLKAAFSKYAENNGETLDYFNFMVVDSDFAQNHNCDAYLSVHYKSDDNVFSTEYKINFEYINKEL